MKHIKNNKYIIDDNLMFAVRDEDTGIIYYQRKRLPDNTEQDIKDDQAKYFEVKGETIPMIKYLRKKYGFGLKQAVDYILLYTGRKTLTQHVL